MKRILFLVTLPAWLLAADLPAYLTNVTGLALTGLRQRESFSFEPGLPAHCTRKEAMDTIFFTCEVTGAKSTVASATGGGMSVNYTRLWARFITLKNQDVMRVYQFTGDYEEKQAAATIQSPVVLELRNLRSFPAEVTGSITIKDYGVSAAISGRQ